MDLVIVAIAVLKERVVLLVIQILGFVNRKTKRTSRRSVLGRLETKSQNTCFVWYQHLKSPPVAAYVPVLELLELLELLLSELLLDELLLSELLLELSELLLELLELSELLLEDELELLLLCCVSLAI